MPTSLHQMLSEGDPRSLGRTEEVIQKVLKKPQLLDELFTCLFSEDEIVRMRAGDALEKVCRVHPGWLQPFIPQLLTEVFHIDQPSVQWHLAQMLGELTLTDKEREAAIKLLTHNLQDTSVDWIVAGYSMETLAQFVANGHLQANILIPLLQLQQSHHSKAVAKRATKILAQLSNAQSI